MTVIIKNTFFDFKLLIYIEKIIIIMKYLKTFENFENPDMNKLLEEMADRFDISLENVKKVIEGKFETLSDEQKDKAYKEMLKLSEKLGLTMEEMTDPFLVEKAIENSKTVNLLDFQNISNESLSTWIKARKSWLLKKLRTLGLVGLVISSVFLGINAEKDMIRAEQSGQDSVVEPSEQTVNSSIATIVSLSIAFLAQLLITRKPKRA